jgi:hypothetical protein
MTGRQRERQLTSIYNRLLAMTADEKRIVLDQMAEQVAAALLG